MTQNDKDLKELLLKDLCARLPYGVKVKTSFDKIDEPTELKSINIKNGTFSVGGEYTTISGISLDTYECKPYLFPLSSMKEEQEIEYDATFETIVYEDGRKDSVMTYKSFDWLNKNHFDYRGLIPKNLAIDATNLGIYN